jgi:hypothetical protein
MAMNLNANLFLAHVNHAQHQIDLLYTNVLKHGLSLSAASELFYLQSLDGEENIDVNEEDIRNFFDKALLSSSILPLLLSPVGQNIWPKYPDFIDKLQKKYGQYETLRPYFILLNPNQRTQENNSFQELSDLCQIAALHPKLYPFVLQSIESKIHNMLRKNRLATQSTPLNFDEIGRYLKKCAADRAHYAVYKKYPEHSVQNEDFIKLVNIYGRLAANVNYQYIDSELCAQLHHVFPKNRLIETTYKIITPEESFENLNPMRQAYLGLIRLSRKPYCIAVWKGLCQMTYALEKAINRVLFLGLAGFRVAMRYFHPEYGFTQTASHPTQSPESHEHKSSESSPLLFSTQSSPTSPINESDLNVSSESHQQEFRS